MKKTIAVVILLAITTGLYGCSKLSRVDAKNFMYAAGSINSMQSAESYSYIGVADGRAYIRHWSAVSFIKSGREEILWVPVSDLPLEIQNKIMSGQNPWPKEIYILTEEKVLELAKLKILETKIELSKFGKPVILRPNDKKNWYVMYTGLESRPGNHFSIVVNDKTQQSELMPGM